MGSVQRFTHRLHPIPISGKCLNTAARSPLRTITVTRFHKTRNPILKPEFSSPKPAFGTGLVTSRSDSSSSPARAGWILGLGEKKEMLPEIVKAGDPVLHEPAREVPLEEIGSERIQKTIDDMVKVMRKAPGVGLAAPQIGIPLKVSLNLQCPSEKLMC